LALYGFAFLLLEGSHAAVREGNYLGISAAIGSLTLGPGAP
jgi:hypothetical protein